LKKDGGSTDDVLVEMSHVYGAETLEKMKPGEFYRLYRDYALGRQ